MVFNVSGARFCFRRIHVNKPRATVPASVRAPSVRDEAIYARNGGKLTGNAPMSEMTHNE